MRHRRPVRTAKVGAAIGVVVGLLLAGCSSQANPAPSSAATRGADGLTVGVLFSQTGGLQAFGEHSTGGVKLATDEINNAGGVNGKPVELFIENDSTDEQIARNKIEQLIAKNVSAVVGPSSSGITLAVIDSVVKAGVVECSPSATSPELTTYPDYGLFFRTVPPDTLQGEVLAARVLADGHKAASIIALNDAYGQGLADAFARSYQAGGGKIVQRVATDPKGTNFDANTATALSGNPQALVLLELPQTGGLVLQNLVKAGMSPANIPTYGAEGLRANSLPGTVDPNNPTVIDGLITTGPPPTSEKFLTRVRPYMPNATEYTYSENAYDCMMIIALAAQAAKSNEPSQIAKFMIAVVTGSTKCTTYPTCQELLSKNVDIGFVGAAGALNMTAAGEPSSGRYSIGKFINGKIVIQETVK